MLKSISLLLVALATIPSVKVVANQTSQNECDNHYYDENQNECADKVAYTLYRTQEQVYEHEKSLRGGKIDNVRTDFGCVIAQNIGQNTLNARYNKIHTNLRVSDTCTEIAVTMAAKFYLDAKYRNTDVEINELEIYEKVMDYARTKHYWQGDRGTEYNTGRYMLQHVLEEYDIISSHWNNYTNMYFGVKDFVESPNYGTLGKVQLFGVQNHVMLAVGYYLIEYDYKVSHQFLWSKWETNEHANKMYIVVCDGFRCGKPASKELVELERFYRYFELGTCEKYINGIDIPEANYLGEKE